MASNILLKLNIIIQRVEHAFPILFGGKFPPGNKLNNLTNILFFFNLNSYRPLPFLGALSLAGIPDFGSSAIRDSPKTTFTLKDLIGDGFLWAVPRNRRTIEKRWKRKFGSPEYVNKLLLPKTNLRICNQCGNDHEVGILCRK